MSRHSIAPFRARITAFISALAPWIVAAGQEDIDRLEYFIDSNPAFGSAASIAITQAETIDVTFSPDVSALGPGTHFLHLRVRNTLGEWSPTTTTPFFLEPGIDTEGDHHIDDLEVVIDPGAGSLAGTSLGPSVPGPEVTANGNISFASETAGILQVNFRARNSTGFWGPVFPVPVFNDVTNSADDSEPLAEIEYFVDNDPGIGDASDLGITPGTSVNADGLVDLSSTSIGGHHLFLRARKADAPWGIPSIVSFFNTYNAQAEPPPDITEIHYAIYDGGSLALQGSYTEFSPASEIDTSFHVNTPGLTPGSDVQLLITLVDGNTAVSLEIQSTVAIREGYEAWRNQHFSGADLIDDDISGLDADPDGDGLPNSVEYALSTDPTADSSMDFPTVARDGDFLEITFRQRIGGTGTPGIDYELDGINYAAEVSSDLSPESWNSGTGVFEVLEAPIDNGDGTETVTVRLKNSIPGEVSQFLRLKITLM